MSIEDKKLAEYRIGLQNKLVVSQKWQSCLNCIHWNSGGTTSRPFDMHCMLFKAMPPPHVIVNGCPDYDNDIPF